MVKVVVSLGQGVLTWDGRERRSDRYGAVYLVAEGDNSLSPGPSPSLISDIPGVKAVEGVKGKLIAHVTATRNSTHIGDMFRGIAPRTPNIGDEFVLGEGAFFTESVADGGLAVGVIPEDGRRNDWLSPRALYDVHEQSVELRLESN